jgi:hypothetical protein
MEWFLLSVLVISVILLLAMFIYRHYELTSGKKFLSDDFREKADEELREFLEKASKKTIAYKNKVNVAVARLIRQIIHGLHEFWHVFSDKVDEHFYRIKSQENSGKKGIISLYWQSSDIESGDMDK